MTEEVIGKSGRLGGPVSADGTLPTEQSGVARRPPAMPLPTDRNAAGTAVLRRTRSRTAVERGRPYHLAVTISAAAGVYALSLAGVTALQAATDARVEAGRRPTANAIARLRAEHDTLEAAVAPIETGYVDAADAYAALAASIADQETALGRLAEVTGRIEGTAASLPTKIRLPALSRSTVPRAATRLVVNATSGASGGG